MGTVLPRPLRDLPASAVDVTTANPFSAFLMSQILFQVGRGGVAVSRCDGACGCALGGMKYKSSVEIPMVSG